MAIKDWPADDRPREKLLNKGPSALSDAELLAIFLRVGSRGKSAVDLARDLLQHFGSLRTILEAEREEFCSGAGLGDAKFVQMQAVMEMARRHLAEALGEGIAMNSSQSVKHYLTAKLRHQRQEVFVALFLNTQHRLLAYRELARGTIDSAAVYPREVAREALRHNAAAVIFAHNHPSGISEPSVADHQLTKSLKKALGLFDIRTLDHFVVGDSNVYSFAENGAI